MIYVVAMVLLVLVGMTGSGLAHPAQPGPGECHRGGAVFTRCPLPGAHAVFRYGSPGVGHPAGPEGEERGRGYRQIFNRIS